MVVSISSIVNTELIRLIKNIMGLRLNKSQPFCVLGGIKVWKIDYQREPLEDRLLLRVL